MLSVNGIYDGKTVKITDRFSEKKQYRVLITFLEEIKRTEDNLRDFAAQTTGLEFWEDSREDIYQDYLLSENPKK